MLRREPIPSRQAIDDRLHMMLRALAYSTMADLMEEQGEDRDFLALADWIDPPIVAAVDEGGIRLTLTLEHTPAANAPTGETARQNEPETEPPRRSRSTAIRRAEDTDEKAIVAVLQEADGPLGALAIEAGLRSHGLRTTAAELKTALAAMETAGVIRWQESREGKGYVLSTSRG